MRRTTADALRSGALRPIPTEHEILERDGEANVTALCEETGASQPVVSQQLSRMRHEGVLARRREGSSVHYRVARREVLGVLECIRKMRR